eukprot:TRINITY_DN56531_c0_g1_i1.p1 TRINITY_DN56531_c0_g1~~TRINITY_DN56531_c0_g1_i1.p1  ORF type:complete len:239 (+),score=62.45 TRINITY_DN56531_c0_g1_i1:161-877(+)
MCIRDRTMDFGPFAFVGPYDPNFCSWTGAQAHEFAFMNQPECGLKNVQSLFEALEPLLDGHPWEQVEAAYREASDAARAEVFRAKLGVDEWTDQTEGLLERLLQAMIGRDWTITWRQLASALESGKPPGDMVALLRLGAISESESEAWAGWLEEWIGVVHDRERGVDMMRAASPKYVPRAWILKRAYEAAEQGDYQPANEIFEVLQRPYEEQEDKEEYYAAEPMGGCSWTVRKQERES